MTKKCRNCGQSSLVENKENHLYTESGLPNVVLVRVTVRRCSSCGHHDVVLPRVAELHRTIAIAVIHKPARLSGPEVRYLRKYLGWSGADFAEHMGVDPSTVSNWENDKVPIGPSSDRVLRLLVAHTAPVEDYDVAELKNIALEQRPPITLRVSPKSQGWQLAAA